MKTAWIFPGGSARGVYTTGAIYALCKIKIPPPDIIIAASGAAPTVVCYITGQHEVIPKVWLESLSTKKFVNFFRFWKIVDIDYLIDTVIRKNNTLDIEKLINSDIQWYFSITDSDTGIIEYVTKNTSFDVWQALKAIVSVPILTNLFSFKGNYVGKKLYSDSVAGARFQLHVKKAINEGANRIIIFDNWHEDDNPANFLYSKIFNYLRNKNYRNNQTEYIKEIENFSIPQNIEYIKISPRSRLGMGRFEINNDNARRVFQLGYDDTINNERIKSLASN